MREPPRISKRLIGSFSASRRLKSLGHVCRRGEDEISIERGRDDWKALRRQRRRPIYLMKLGEDPGMNHGRIGPEIN